jgi:sugar (pentulose or hexulose) kinase
MGKNLRVLTFDCGSSSGRIIAGDFDGNRLGLTELARFSNYPVEMGGVLYWDIMQMWQNAKLGIREAASKGEFRSITVDTWGCDVLLLRRDGQLLQNLVCYRDGSLKGVLAGVNARFTSGELYQKMGGFYFYSSAVATLTKMREEYPGALDAAALMLPLPDYFNFLLSGEKYCEYTIASTLQLTDPRSGQWHRGLVDALGIPEKILLPVGGSGHVLGEFTPSLGGELGLSGAKVIAACGHDSAAAMAAVPARGDEPWLCISSGSWSVLMFPSKGPYLDAGPDYYGFMHEGCYGGVNRIVYNQVGMWLVQELRRGFGNQSYDEMDAKARGAEPFRSIIMPQQFRQMYIDDLPGAMREYCEKTGQPVPRTQGELVRCVYDSIALNSAVLIGKMEKLGGAAFARIHVVGGGTHNEIILQSIADLTGREVVAGPEEAAVTGNILVQLIALGALSDLAEARELVRNSFGIRSYYPENSPPVEAAAYTGRMYDDMERAGQGESRGNRSAPPACSVT